MNRRRREILNQLFNRDGYITGINLAKSCNVSLSTIRFDIKEINKELGEYEIAIRSALQKGYYLSNQDKDQIRKNNIIRAVIDQEYVTEMPSTPLERRMYIILQLTTFDHLEIEYLANVLFISASTLNNDVTGARKWLKNNLDLNLRYSLKNGVRLNCDERAKRNIIVWMLTQNTNESSMLKVCSYISGGQEVIAIHKSLLPVIIDVTSTHGYVLSGHSLVLVSGIIAVSLARHQRGYFLDPSNETDEKLLDVIEALRARFDDMAVYSLPENEWQLVQKYFLACQFVRNSDPANFADPQVSEGLGEFYDLVNEKYGYQLEASRRLNDNLRRYLPPMLQRLKYKYPVSNRIDQSIVGHYELEYQLAQEISGIVARHWGLGVNKTELAYLTLHLAATKTDWDVKIRTVIVCDYDESVISFIENRILEQFSNQVEVVAWYSYQEFVYGLEVDPTQIDLVVTTATLADRTLIPIIMVSPFMNQSEINKIQDYLDQVSKMIKKQN